MKKMSQFNCQFDVTFLFWGKVRKANKIYLGCDQEITSSNNLRTQNRQC